MLTLDAIERSVKDFDQSHPTRGACQHERHWRQVLPRLIEELRASREALEKAET